MNLLNRTTMILTFALVPLFMSTPTYGQQNTINKDQMNRDLSISEDILGKIFSDNYNQSLPFGDQAVNASYLPGYGIAYYVSGSSFAIFRHAGMGRLSNMMNNDRSRSNGNSNGKVQGSTGAVVIGGPGRGLRWMANQKMTRQQVIDRATEFLSNYGSTIGQLQPSDRITIIYKDNANDFMPYRLMQAMGQDSSQAKPLNLSISAKKADIAALNQNRITKKEFANRLAIDDLENGDQHKDLDIFAEILSRALKNTHQYEYSSRGDVNYAFMKEFGAIYFLNAQYSLQYLSAVADMPVVVQENGNKVTVTSAQNDDKEMRKAYDRFVAAMKGYITNYGRTLHSLSGNQSLVISVNLDDGIGRQEKRETFTIKEDVLERLNNGKITANQAEKDIEVRSF